MNKQLLDALIADVGMDELVHRIFAAMGGKANVIAVDSCMTRLRVTLHDQHVVNTEDLKALGAFSVFDMGEQVHVMFGLQSFHIMQTMKPLI